MQTSRLRLRPGSRSLARLSRPRPRERRFATRCAVAQPKARVNARRSSCQVKATCKLHKWRLHSTDFVTEPSVDKDLTSQTGAFQPLGPSPTPQGVNFALYSRHASVVTLCLFDAGNQLLKEFRLDSATHRTADIWHVEIVNLPKRGVMYGYKLEGEGGWESGNRWEKERVLLDPYAPLVASRERFGVRDEKETFQSNVGSRFLGTFDFESEPYDWGDDARPRIREQDLVIYEMPVRSFTADPSSGLPESEKGTFKGVMEKIPHLVSLGVNAVELLPVFEYDEMEFQRFKNPRDHMINIWGYSHLNFFAPMSRFATRGDGPLAAARQFKDMVAAFHRVGIEVILDVVYNHTAESDDKTAYPVSFRGIDSKVYYMTDTSSFVQLVNYSGCGNTVNANHPVVTQLILDSLRHWVQEYHVDGFRFDLASCLCRDELGHPIAAPPVIRAISKDPVLKDCKLIAEPWDLGMYQVGQFPNWDRWSEWNGMYRDDVRRFVKGDGGMKKALAKRLCGSADLYQNNNRKPYHSINFVVAHDGFTLHDLVAYNQKHNEANGEGNNDGSNDNFSWNCGAEGETEDGGVRRLRAKQMRNMIAVLMLSQGTPMILCGDEYGHTCYGNNNWYGHNSEMTWFQWEKLQHGEGNDLFRFTSEMIKFRKQHPALGRAEFVGKGDITWHEDQWDNEDSRFLAFTWHDREGGADLYCALNAHGFAIESHLPPAPSGKRWCRVVDTNLPPPKDFTPGGNDGVEQTYRVESYSSIVLMAK